MTSRPGSGRRRLLTVAVVVVTVLVAAVAVTSVLVLRSPGGGGADDLALRVASVGLSDRLVVADLDAARESLGLPDDADLHASYGGSESEQRFLAVTAALPHLLRSAVPEVGEAFDVGAMSAVASNVAPASGSVTVVATSQTFDDVVRSLEPLGYARDGDLLTVDPGAAATERLVYTAVAGADGLLAMSTDREDGAGLVEQALAAPGETDDELLDAVGDASGPVVGAVRAEDCATAYGFADPLDGDATFFVATDSADEVEVADPLPFRGTESGAAETGGVGVELPLAATDQVIGGVGSLVLSPEYLPTQVYTCG